MKKRTRANQSALFSPDYLIFFALIIIIAAVSSWQVPARLNVPSETALMYCNDAYLDRVEYSSSVKTVKVISMLPGGGATYHVVQETSFQCPVVAPETMSDECRGMLEVSDWELVCEGEKGALSDSDIMEEDEHDSKEEKQHPDITVMQPVFSDVVSSPLHVEGEAKGTWFFEGDFPVVITDWDGRIIGEGFATAQGDWMNESFVPFEGNIAFTVSEDMPYHSGTVIFQKNNPSGLPEHDDAHEVTVFFEETATTTQDIFGIEVN